MTHTTPAKTSKADAAYQAVEVSRREHPNASLADLLQMNKASAANYYAGRKRALAAGEKKPAMAKTAPKRSNGKGPVEYIAIESGRMAFLYGTPDQIKQVIQAL